MSKITVKTDQEPAILAIAEDLARIRASNGGGETISENSPTYSHQSNGIIERGVQSVEGMIRTLRSALEERMGETLEIGDAIWPWLIEYASYLLNRREVSHDGKTAYERLRGKSAKVLGVEFGETVMWKRRPIGGPLGKLSIMWDEGVFLGIKGTTSEIIIGAGRSTYRTRSIKRKPVEERWNWENIRGGVFGNPWDKHDPNLKGNLEKIRVREFSEEEKRLFEEAKQKEK